MQTRFCNLGVLSVVKTDGNANVRCAPTLLVLYQLGTGGHTAYVTAAAIGVARFLPGRPSVLLSVVKVKIELNFLLQLLKSFANLLPTMSRKLSSTISVSMCSPSTLYSYSIFDSKCQLSLNPRDALHHCKRAANKGGRSV